MDRQHQQQRPGYFVNKFAVLMDYHCIYYWWAITSVRVHFMLEVDIDYDERRLFLVLLDNAGQKMLARIPCQMRSYVQANVKIGDMYRMEHFQVEPLPFDGLRYENYKLTNDDFMIAIDDRRTTLVSLQIDPNFPIYPTPQPIEQIMAIPRGKYLTDVLGQVSYAQQVNFDKWRGRELVPSVKIYLLHPT